MNRKLNFYQQKKEVKKIKAKLQTTSLVAIAAILLIVSTVSTADAEPTQIIQGSIDGTSISIMHDGITNIVILEKDGITSEHWDGVIKQYNSGGFVIKNIESGIVLFAHSIGNEQYRLVVITNDSVYRLIGVSEIISELDATVAPSSSSLYDEPVSSVGADITKYDIPTDTSRSYEKEPSISVRVDSLDTFFVTREYGINISVVDEHEKGVMSIVDIDISRDGETVKTLSGTTSSLGTWNTILNVDSSKFTPGFCYDVSIIAVSGNYTDTVKEDFIVSTTAKYWDSTADPIDADAHCN